MKCQFMFNPFMFGDNDRCGLREGHKDEHVPMDVVHTTALSAIHQLMDEKEWSPDTLDSIAEILEQAGFPIRDANAAEEIAEAKENPPFESNDELPEGE